MNLFPMLIREAQPEDAEQIANMHRKSVKELGAEYYPKDILDKWSPPAAEKRIEKFRSCIENRDDTEVCLVAEVGSRIVGFTHVVPTDSQYWALYVHPAYTRQGIGTQLLRVAETQAKKHTDYLELASSLVAEPFYRAHGYRVTDRGTLRDTDMECVYMEKTLNS